MSDRRRALGRGLGALISNSGSNSARSETEEPASPAPVESSSGQEASDGVTWLQVDQVDPNPAQPRRVFDPRKLETLAASILQHGVLQPVVVQAV